MDKAQAIQNFWSSFGLKAYDENTVPDNPVFPYITYELAEDFFDTDVDVSASIWYKSTSWAGVTAKASQIAQVIGYGGTCINYDGGLAWIKRGSPFIRRMNDPNDSDIRRIVLNVEIEYMSE